MTKKIKIVFTILVLGFALFGLFFLGGFLALRLGLTKTGGETDFNDRYFTEFHQTTDGLSRGSVKAEDFCKLAIISQIQPSMARGLFEIMDHSGDGVVLSRAILAQEIYLKEVDSYRQALAVCLEQGDATKAQLSDWRDLAEWQTLRVAIIKDVDVINLAAVHAGVDPRLLVSVLVVEQLRLFTSEREVFKQIFQPLKILGTQSKFSWGVMGMKEETARAVEENLKNPSSPFYLDSKFENLLDFSSVETINQESLRFERLTNQRDHYYSYLYAALFLKQIMAQWDRAGYNIDNRPEILATLFNLGFDKSVPKSKPEAGGAEIEIGDKVYSFGGLAFQFYYSGELANYFPLIIK